MDFIKSIASLVRARQCSQTYLNTLGLHKTSGEKALAGGAFEGEHRPNLAKCATFDTQLGPARVGLARKSGHHKRERAGSAPPFLTWYDTAPIS
ncbi:MAG: hypothetical protein ABJL99_25095 [Aliishimia sp.]